MEAARATKMPRGLRCDGSAMTSELSWRSRESSEGLAFLPATGGICLERDFPVLDPVGML